MVGCGMFFPSYEGACEPMRATDIAGVAFNIADVDTDSIVPGL